MGALATIRRLATKATPWQLRLRREENSLLDFKFRKPLLLLGSTAANFPPRFQLDNPDIAILPLPAVVLQMDPAWRVGFLLTTACLFLQFDLVVDQHAIVPDTENSIA